MRIGVLAVQGDFALHINVLRQLGVEATEVRYAKQLCDLSGIIIPGGESTSFHTLLESDDLGERLRYALNTGLPAWGTCAGAIMLGHGEGRPQPRWGMMDIDLLRNGYGRQTDSFVASFPVNGWEAVFTGVFIRAPRIVRAGKEVEILATYDQDPVMVRQGRRLATTFHPELTADNRIHRYFLEEVV